MTRILLLTAGALSLAACGSPRHLQYDHGRSYTAAYTAQADLTRPSAANSAFTLSGVEAAAIRINVTESTAEAKTGESQLKQGTK